MNYTIRPMLRDDAPYVIDMMRVFYASPAVLSNGSEEIFQNDVENCVNDSPYLEGYIIEDGQKIKAEHFQNGWIEFDTNEDYETACRWVEVGTLSRFIEL